LCNAIPFIVCPAERNTLVKPALHDGATGCVNSRESSHRSTCNQHASDSGKNKYQSNDPYKRSLNISSKGIKVVDVLAQQQMITVGKCVQRCVEHWLVSSIAFPPLHTKILPPLGIRDGGRPYSLVAGNKRI